MQIEADLSAPAFVQDNLLQGHFWWRAVGEERACLFLNTTVVKCKILFTTSIHEVLRGVSTKMQNSNNCAYRFLEWKISHVIGIGYFFSGKIMNPYISPSCKKLQHTQRRHGLLNLGVHGLT